ncbi:MAG TPA: cytochrome c, partial [Polyangiales bacterium]|nr:cytochrome c [Polyangiales bacterium]
PRRTQALRGGILGSEPFHWNGDMANFDVLVSDVFAGRMSGFQTRKDQSDALAHWIDEVPAFKVEPADAKAVERGEKLFESDALGCAGCHTGSLLTNNQTADVGTGVDVQVPSLHNVSFRLPLMHDGCAETLIDRFGSCGGGDKHGHTSDLSKSELSDLIAYLESL